MNVLGVEIKDLKRKGHTTGAKSIRSVYTGHFACPGKALDLLHFSQLSVTKSTRNDEHGNAEWGETVTTFQLMGQNIPFNTLAELITYHNTKQSMRKLKLGKLALSISSCGTIIMQGDKRKVIHKRKLKNQRLMHEVHAGNRTHRVRRLVALAWLGEPEKSNLRVLLKDGNEENLHYTNLYWSASSHNEEEMEVAKSHLKQYQ